MTYGEGYASTPTELARPEPFRASASNVTTFADCQRKWAWVVIDGRARVSSEAADLGTRVHKVLEDYMSQGVPLNLDTREGQIAMAGVHLLPPPGTMATERLFSVRIGPDGSNDSRGILFVGRMDLSNRAGDPPRVVDHKTTSDFKWAKTPEGLQEDMQAALYAAVVLDGGTDAAAVPLRWVYYRTQKPHRGMPVDTVLYPAPRKKTLARAHAVASVMLRVYNDPTVKTALDLPPNWNVCGRFGGCPYRGDCAASDPQNERLFHTLFPEEHMPKDTSDWRYTPEGERKYREAFNAAVDKANAIGCDVGLEKNDPFKTFLTFLLPTPENRYGHERTCQVVRPGETKMSDPLAALAALAAQGHTPVAINPPTSQGLPPQPAALPPQPAALPPQPAALPPQPAALPPQPAALPDLPPSPATPPRHPMAGKVSDDGRFILSYDGQWVPCEPQKAPSPVAEARAATAAALPTEPVYRTETPVAAPAKRGPGRPRKVVSENGDGPNDPSDAEIAAAVRVLARLFNGGE